MKDKREEETESIIREQQNITPNNNDLTHLTLSPHYLRVQHEVKGDNLECLCVLWGLGAQVVDEGAVQATLLPPRVSAAAQQRLKLTVLPQCVNYVRHLTVPSNANEKADLGW